MNTSIVPTYFVTFPRSGHHYLQRILARVFSSDLHYCETYTHPERRMSVCPDTNMEKTHDFGLDFIPGTIPVIVQCRRDPAAAIRSLRNATCPDEPMETFAKSRQRYWLGFLDRWCGGSLPIIWYEDLLSNPVKCVRTVVDLMTLKESVRYHEAVIPAIEAELSWPVYGIGERPCFDPYPPI